MATESTESTTSAQDDRDLVARLLTLWGIGAVFVLASATVLGFAVRLFHIGAGG